MLVGGSAATGVCVCERVANGWNDVRVLSLGSRLRACGGGRTPQRLTGSMA